MQRPEELTPPAPGIRARARELLQRPRVRLVGLVALALAVAVAAFLVTSILRSSDAGTELSVEPLGPVGLTAPALATLASSAGQPIYWAGPREGHLYELTRTSTGDVLVRYLPPGVEVGAKGSGYLVIATYPFEDAFQALQNVAESPKYDIPGGGIAVVDERTASSVHVAYPGRNYQVEVFDPSPARALEIARSGDVRPAG